MSSKTPPQAEPVEYQTARDITAQVLAETIHSEVSVQQHLRALGDYLICSSLASVVSGAGLEEQFSEGLAQVGVQPADIQNLYELGNKPGNRRLIFSLAYVPEQTEVSGIRRGVRSNWMEESEFIYGILERRSTKDNPQSA